MSVTVSRTTDRLKVGVSATDNVKVTKVFVYVDGKLVAKDSSMPYSLLIDLRQFASGPHTLEVRASDRAGNIGSSGPIAFTR